MVDINKRLTRILLFCAIPAVAVTIATRQAYLNTYYGLSTWKGGGMGMFASADSGSNRFVRVYLETPDGRREPIIRLNYEQDAMMQRALWYPAPHNFRDLALSLRRMTFIASDQPSPVSRNDVDGNRTGPTGRTHLLLHADATRPRGEDPPWTIVIEYWTASFDPLTRLATAKIASTMRFGPGES